MAHAPKDEHEKETLVLWVMCLDEVLGWYQRAVFDGLTLKRKRGLWQLRVQARFGRDHKVVFLEAKRPYELLKGFAVLLNRNQLRWFEDKYPPDVGD